MKRFKSIALLAIALLVMAVYAVPAPSASAQSASLSLNPKKNYVIDAGDSVKDKLTIRNLDFQSPLDLNLKVIDFTYTNSGGTPKLLLDPNLAPTTWSLKPFLKVPQTVNVGPGETKTVDISVSIPAGQGAGSFYSAIMYSTGAPDGGNVGLAASGVTLVFVSVPGQVNEELNLKKFGVYDPKANGDEKGYMFITGNEPQVMAYTLENKGNVTESPVGMITLKDIFGNEWVIEDVNPTKSLALIGQTRTFTSCIKLKSQEVDFNGSVAEASTCASPGLWPGIYTANLNLFYGQNGNNTEEITSTTVFLYLPLWFLVILAILALVITYYVWRFVRMIKGKGQGRISRSRKRPVARRR